MLVPETPALAFIVVVPTVIPVVFELVGVVVNTPLPFPAKASPPRRGASGSAWLCPGSVTTEVEVAVCVWLTTAESLEPPVAPTVTVPAEADIVVLAKY